MTILSKQITQQWSVHTHNLNYHSAIRNKEPKLNANKSVLTLSNISV